MNRKHFLQELLRQQMDAQQTSQPQVGNYQKTGRKITSAARITSTLSPYSGPWTETQVRHLLRRTTFGVRYADINLLLGMTMDAAVDYLFSKSLKAFFFSQDD